ncbi:MAG: hypothetical protein ACAH83_14275 [Alphaproteobacteria bacterium]
MMTGEDEMKPNDTGAKSLRSRFMALSLTTRRRLIWWPFILYAFAAHLLYSLLIPPDVADFYASKIALLLVLFYFLVLFWPALVIFSFWPVSPNASSEDRFVDCFLAAMMYVICAFMIQLLFVSGHGS